MLDTSDRTVYTSLTTKIYDSASLLEAHCLPALVELINAAYAAHFTQFIPPDPSVKRLQDPNALATEIEGGGFTVVAFDEAEPIATASIKPVYNIESASAYQDWSEQGRATYRQWKATQTPVSGIWEITAVATKYHERYLKRGIAAMVLDVVVEELKRRLRSMKQEEKELTLQLRVVKEVNGEYRAKKGFQVVEETVVAPGVIGNDQELKDWKMEKVITFD